MLFIIIIQLVPGLLETPLLSPPTCDDGREFGLGRWGGTGARGELPTGLCGGGGLSNALKKEYDDKAGCVGGMGA